jgi:hypothetical protein
VIQHDIKLKVISLIGTLTLLFTSHFTYILLIEPHQLRESLNLYVRGSVWDYGFNKCDFKIYVFAIK